MVGRVVGIVVQTIMLLKKAETKSLGISLMESLKGCIVDWKDHKLKMQFDLA
jgi:hypothetical protein